MYNGNIRQIRWGTQQLNQDKELLDEDVGQNHLFINDEYKNVGSVPDQPINNYKYNDIGQLTGIDVTDYEDASTDHSIPHYFEYDVYGKVTGIFSDVNHTAPIETYTYDELGFRIQKDNGATRTTYVRDLSGNIIAIYENDYANSTGLELKEMPIYGASRLGTMDWATTRYRYELTDHLGNVRAVVTQPADATATHAEVLAYTDYYPFGWEMPGRQFVAQSYRFGYQGQFAEKDEKTGYNDFQLRKYDSRIGRWLTTDPKGVGFSPYWVMPLT